MSFGRAQIDGGANYRRGQGPGDTVLDQTQQFPVTTAGAGTITAAAMASGYIERTGPGAGFNETLETADNLMAANPQFSVGDSFEFLYRNTVAFAGTPVVAEGAELAGANTVVPASAVRKFLVTILSTARRQSYLANMTNGSPTITGLTQAQVQALMPGMGVSSASGIAGGTTVLAVNAVLGTVTLSANASVTQSIAVTFFPRYNIRGLWTASL